MKAALGIVESLSKAPTNKQELIAGVEASEMSLREKGYNEVADDLKTAALVLHASATTKEGLAKLAAISRSTK